MSFARGLTTVCAVICFLLVAVLFSFFLKGFGIAERAADQTILNVDKAVWSYEEFFKKAEQYKQYESQIKDAKEQLANETDQQNKDNLNMEINGARQMMRRIAADYNAMSKVAYQKIWKDKNLPETLGE